MNRVPLLKERPILVLESDDRNTADNEALAEALKKAGNSEVTEQHMRTDHAFSSDRNASRDRELAGRHRQKTSIEPSEDCGPASHHGWLVVNPEAIARDIWSSNRVNVEVIRRLCRSTAQESIFLVHSWSIICYSTFQIPVVGAAHACVVSNALSRQHPPGLTVFSTVEVKRDKRAA